VPDTTVSKAETAMLRVGDVARMFDVSERTVARWARTGKLPCIRTLGGRLRFRLEDVEAALSTKPSLEASA
jgi:excisionase family DNA binding protein